MNGARGPILVLGILALMFAAAAAVHADAVTLGDRERTQLVALESIRGEAVKPSDLRNKAVVITFFASWCPPCRVEFLHLNRMTGEFEGSGLTIVAINVFEEFDQNDQVRMSRFLDDTGPLFTVVKGDQAIKRAFGDVQRIPTVLVFDRAGRPVMHFIHARGAKKMSATEDELRMAVSRALTR